jgi:iduronate 2-sulfatase
MRTRILYRGAAAAVGLAAAAAGAAGKPNVLLICVDDLKPLLGCYGSTAAATPNIDRLAGRGLLFERAYCNQAVCAPSRNALMTGLRPETIGVYDLATFFRKAAPDAVTVGQHFKSHGYRVESMGKIYHSGHGNEQDEGVSWSVKNWRPSGGGYLLPASQAMQKASRAEAVAKGLTGMQLSQAARGPSTECADVADSDYADGMIADEAIRRIGEAAKAGAEPFFFGVGFLKPHLAFVAPKRYWDLYAPDRLPMPSVTEPPADSPSYAWPTWGELRKYGDIPAEGPLDEATTRRLIHGYYACVSYIDAQIGRLLKALDESGLADRTIIVLWGDHGWHLGDHGFWCKHSNYEQAAHIPLIVSAPALSRGKRTAALAETVDLYPTLCDLADLPIPEGLDGASLVPVLKNPAASVRDAATHVYPRGDRIGRAVRDARYRMVEWKVPGAPANTAEIELYDYEKDPAETKNRAADHPDIVARMRAVLAARPEAKPQWKAPRPEKKKSGSRK